MNALFPFDLFMVYIPECIQQLRTTKYYTQIRDSSHINLGCSFNTLKEPCNDQRPKCDSTWFHDANDL